jgi:short-subunit dehydrogenase
MKKVFIVGGTSGIGEELARYYLNQGCRVAVCGRDLSKSKLEKVEKFEVDVKNKEEIFSAVKNFSEGKLDLLFYCAAVYFDSEKTNLSVDQVRDTVNTNILGLIHSFDSALENMSEGKLVAIASVAAKHNTSMYAESKAAVLYTAETYRRGLKNHDISVHTMLPGYVDTQKLRELNDGDISEKPFVISVEKAVSEILNALSENRETYMFPKEMVFITNILSLFPVTFRIWIKKRFS